MRQKVIFKKNYTEVNKERYPYTFEDFKLNPIHRKRLLGLLDDCKNTVVEFDSEWLPEQTKEPTITLLKSNFEEHNLRLSHIKSLPFKTVYTKKETKNRQNILLSILIGIAFGLVGINTHDAKKIEAIETRYSHKKLTDDHNKKSRKKRNKALRSNLLRILEQPGILSSLRLTHNNATLVVKSRSPIPKQYFEIPNTKLSQQQTTQLNSIFSYQWEYTW